MYFISIEFYNPKVAPNFLEIVNLSL